MTTWNLRTGALILAVLPAAAAALAQPWSGWIEESARLQARRMDFGAPGGSNENYYDGDFADFDGDFRVDRALISRFGLCWNMRGGELYPVSTQRIDLATGSASGPQSLPTWTGFRFGDGYAGNDAVQWADLDGDGDPDSIQGGNGEPFVIQSNRAGRFVETARYSGSALNIATTDVEGDGDVDLAVAHAFCSNRNCGGPVDFRLWINDGGGRLSEQSAARGLGAYRAEAQLVVGVVSGDVDGDRDFDLLLLVGVRESDGTKRNAVIVAVNDGTGIYSERIAPFARPLAELDYVGSGFGQLLQLGDVDSDGDLDLVVAGPPNADPDTRLPRPIGMHPNVSHVVMVNDGAGNFTDESATRWDVGSYPGVLVGENAKLVDADFDGDLDYVAFDKPGPDFFQVFLNDGAGRFTYRPDLDPGGWVNLGRGLGVDLDVTDLDGDGSYDVWVGVAALPPNLLINTHRTPSGLPADAPRNVRLVTADASGVTIAWEHPPFAAANRHYQVLRTPAAGAEPRDRPVLATIARSPHEDDTFAAPITASTTTAELGHPDVVLDGATGTVTFVDRTALPGVGYRYSIVHVGTERTRSQPSGEVVAALPDPDPSAPDTTAPELRIVSPTIEEWGRHPRVVLEFGDDRSGIDLSTLDVSFDVPLGTGDPASGGRAAGASIADLAWRKDQGTYVYRLERPLRLPPGIATLTARVADLAGNVAQRTQRFDVSQDVAADPTASFTAAQRAVGQAVDFDAGASGDADGIVMRHEWSFGDGATGEGRVAWHRYRDPGDHLVRLIVRDNDGGVDVAEQVVTVAPSDVDTDGDGLTDGEEIDGGLDPDRADTDGDGAADGADCLPLDGRYASGAGEVTGLRVAGGAVTTLTWADPSPAWGPDVLHDVLVGSLAGLSSAGLDASSSCAFDDLDASLFLDVAPPPAGGAFYLVRAVNACGSDGDWGADSFGTPRVAGACGAP